MCITLDYLYLFGTCVLKSQAEGKQTQESSGSNPRCFPFTDKGFYTFQLGMLCAPYL